MAKLLAAGIAPAAAAAGADVNTEAALLFIDAMGEVLTEAMGEVAEVSCTLLPSQEASDMARSLRFLGFLFSRSRPAPECGRMAALEALEEEDGKEDEEEEEGVTEGLGLEEEVLNRAVEDIMLKMLSMVTKVWGGTGDPCYPNLFGGEGKRRARKRVPGRRRPGRRVNRKDDERKAGVSH